MNSRCLGKDDVAVKDTGLKSVLEAMLLIMDALSQKDGKKEFLSQLKNKLFSGLDIARMEDKLKSSPETCNKNTEKLCDGKADSLKVLFPSLVHVVETKDNRQNDNTKEEAKLQAAMLCAEALSCSKVDVETRMFTLGKIFEGLANVHSEEQTHYLRKVCQNSQMQDGSLDFSSHMENAGGKAQSELKEGFSVKPKYESLEKIFLFLKNACAQGDLELKEVYKFLKCFSVTNMENLDGEANVPQHAMSEHAHATFDGKELFEAFGKQQEKDFSKEDDDLQGPLDINHPVITQGSVPIAAPTPRKELLSSLTDNQGKESCSCCHVLQKLPKPSCNADEKYKRDKAPDFLAPNCKVSADFLAPINKVKNSADKGESISEIHVTPSNSTFSFLEAAKKGLTISPSKDAVNVSNDNNKNGQSKSTSSEDPLTFKIEEKIFLQRLDMCKFSVVARVSLAKGEVPWV